MYKNDFMIWHIDNFVIIFWLYIKDVGNYKNQTKVLLFPYKLHVVTTLFAVHCCLQYITSFSIFFSRQRKVFKNFKSVHHLFDKKNSVSSILKSLYFIFKEFTTMHSYAQTNAQTLRYRLSDSMVSLFFRLF